MKIVSQIILGVFVLGLAIIVGCNEPATDNPIAPDQAITQDRQFEFVSFNDMVDMPISMRKMEASVTQTIDPIVGGVLRYTTSGTGADGTPWRINWQLSFPAGAVTSKMSVTAVIQYDTLGNVLTTSFTPSPTSFKKPGSLSIDISGLDTVKFGSWRWGTGKVSFMCINPLTKKWEVMIGGSVTANAATRTFSAKACVVPHFSRYAFARVD